MTAAVTMSSRAAGRIGEILAKEGRGTMLRVSVEGRGCSGFQYRFDMERTRAEDDLVLSQDGAVRGRLAARGEFLRRCARVAASLSGRSPARVRCGAYERVAAVPARRLPRHDAYARRDHSASRRQRPAAPRIRSPSSAIAGM